MRAYGGFCPVAKASEIIAERWTPLIIRELLTGSHRFHTLEQGVPGIPHSLLAQRLRSLERAGVVERRAAASGNVRNLIRHSSGFDCLLRIAPADHRYRARTSDCLRDRDRACIERRHLEDTHWSIPDDRL